LTTDRIYESESIPDRRPYSSRRRGHGGREDGNPIAETLLEVTREVDGDGTM
jgi:hypothetical protein